MPGQSSRDENVELFSGTIEDWFPSDRGRHQRCQTPNVIGTLVAVVGGFSDIIRSCIARHDIDHHQREIWGQSPGVLTALRWPSLGDPVLQRRKEEAAEEEEGEGEGGATPSRAGAPAPPAPHVI